MSDDKPDVGVMTEAEVLLADDSVTVWSLEDDGLRDVAVTETNALTIIGEGDRILAVYSPVFWLRATPTYAASV